MTAHIMFDEIYIPLLTQLRSNHLAVFYQMHVVDLMITETELRHEESDVRLTKLFNNSINIP
jgi:hypothetical protein